MKNPKITLTKDGLILIDAPEKYFKCVKVMICLDKGFHPPVCKCYTQALEKSINEGVKFEGPLMPLVNIYGTLESDKLYDIPKEYQVKLKTDHPHEECKLECICTYADDYYAVLEPLTKQEPDIEKKKIEIKEKLGVYSTTVLSTPVIEQKEEDCFYCENREDEAMMRCGVQCDTCKLTESKQLTPDGWISVKERLPETEVLAIGYQNEMIIGYIGKGEAKGFVCENDNEFLTHVTHWMPLPNPPHVNDNSNDR